MTHLVLLAGGVGERVGAGMPKQFVEVLGRPVIAYTLEIFEKHREIDDILVVCHREWRDVLDEIVRVNGFRKVVKVVDGGEDFQMGEADGHFTYVEDPDGTLIEFVETFKIPVLKKLGIYINLKDKNEQITELARHLLPDASVAVEAFSADLS